MLKGMPSSELWLSNLLIKRSFLDSALLMLSVNAHEDDVWCVDPRGHLTLSVCKDSYERLGLVGKKLPFKIHDDRHGTLLYLTFWTI